MSCKICGTPAAPFGEAMVLAKHPVHYFRCPSCGFVQSEPPYWLDEAYAEAITRSDLGLVGRNVALARRVTPLILAFFNEQGRFLDYGGGYGIFVRLMRDAGLDFYLHDKYCDNLFAQGFAIEEPPAQPFELVTAFELFEHLVEPMEEIARLQQFSPSILFTTELLPEPAPRPGEWWYYGLEHGQHLSLYSRAALAHIARELGVNLLSDGHRFHLLTPRAISPRHFRWLHHRWLAPFLRRWLGRKLAGRSLLPQDYERVTGRPLT